MVGESSGIGLAVAQKSLDAGAKVIIAARNMAKLATAARRLGDGVLTKTLDASDENAVMRFFEGVGLFDHLVIAIKPTLPEGSALLGDARIARLGCAGDLPKVPEAWPKQRFHQTGCPSCGHVGRGARAGVGRGGRWHGTHRRSQ